MKEWLLECWRQHRQAIIGGAAVTLVVVATTLIVPAQDLIDFHRNTLRAPFFTAFLTLAGFLLSLKTFIVVKMKELVYDDAGYIESAVRLDIERGRTLEHYGPLRRLSGLLFAAILACFAAAILQFTVGLLKARYSAVLCVCAPSLALYLLVYSLIETRANLRSMFEVAEKRRRAEKMALAEKFRGEASTPKLTAEGRTK